MNFKEFEENYNFAPYTLDEFAEAAAGITDNTALSIAAQDYLDAQLIFEDELCGTGIELG